MPQSTLYAVLGQSLSRRLGLKTVGSSRQLAGAQYRGDPVLHEERDEDEMTTSSTNGDSRSAGPVYFDVGDDISYVAHSLSTIF